VKDGGEQNKEDYKLVNSMAQVPTLVFGDGLSITQSLAIIEYLDERFPDRNPLMPNDIVGKVKVFISNTRFSNSDRPLTLKSRYVS